MSPAEKRAALVELAAATRATAARGGDLEEVADRAADVSLAGAFDDVTWETHDEIEAENSRFYPSNREFAARIEHKLLCLAFVGSV